jgi:hypothetical protein
MASSGSLDSSTFSCITGAPSSLNFYLLPHEVSLALGSKANGRYWLLELYDFVRSRPIRLSIKLRM